MLPFRSEIRNTPSQATIKIYLSNPALDANVKQHLEAFNEIETIELRESIGQNRVKENITVFLKHGFDINKTKEAIDTGLRTYFEAQ